MPSASPAFLNAGGAEGILPPHPNPVLTIGSLWWGSKAGGATVNNGVTGQAGKEGYGVQKPTDICQEFKGEFLSPAEGVSLSRVRPPHFTSCARSLLDAREPRFHIHAFLNLSLIHI